MHTPIKIIASTATCTEFLVTTSTTPLNITDTYSSIVLLLSLLMVLFRLVLFILMSLFRPVKCLRFEISLQSLL